MQSNRSQARILSLFVGLFFFFLGMLVPQILVAEYRHHDAHEHGVAHLNVALEGKDLYIELISPAANIVGFEHHPRTDAQKDAVNKAIETLKAGERLFVFPPGVECELAEAIVHTDIERDHDHESGEAPSQAHGDSSRNADEKKHQHRDHQGDDNHARHSEFKAEYHFGCKQTGKLTHLSINLFQQFPGIEHIEVQLLTGKKQTALELTRKANIIAF